MVELFVIVAYDWGPFPLAWPSGQDKLDAGIQRLVQVAVLNILFGPAGI